MMGFVPAEQRGAGPQSAAELVELLARLRRGDADALEPLYRRESGPVYRYALALSGNAAWAGDAMQDAFVALAARPEGFDPLRGSLGAYLAGMARHSLLARWREARQQLAEAPDEDEAGRADAGGGAESPEALLVRAQDQAELWRAIQALPWPFREALVLVDLQERAYMEAARIAGVEINTLRTRLHRARQRLAALLNGAAAGVQQR
ncbi:RNA polymerase sigma factor [Roseateles violae]|uniref:RNA polymerase sigma factor n=1 Tax=Roseateles violae TaxID=3058042 RepID=A0ABT8DKT9_9BURK|nr:RNA polymerase sigma factor [Pelomonas sp. PFR6]MDN3919031.1 RNA polymerase sigma factor [Pelomonas sp. PFR6]